MESATHYTLEPVHVLMLSVLVLYLGLYLNRKIRLLAENYIPPAVTGGLICSGIVAVIYALFDLEISFDMQIRDVLLLVFFSTIGLSAKLQLLKEGGRLLATLGGATLLFLVLQNAVGVGTATLFGLPWVNGLLGGSISLAGGHGTAGPPGLRRTRS